MNSGIQINIAVDYIPQHLIGSYRHLMPKGIPFLFGRGRCIFCELQPPSVKISKEHVFADWLREIFPRTADTTHTLGVTQWAGSPGRTPAMETRKQQQGHSGTRKIRLVCKTCNETWLSNKIEKIAKPILTPLIKGEQMEISPSMQQVLASWATKTVMTAEHLHPNKVVIHQAERTWLKENLIPPAGWDVWAGTYHGLAWGELVIQQHAAKLRRLTFDNGNLVEHNLVFTILGMRRLIFVVVSSTWPRMREIIEIAGNPNGQCLSRIWPIQASVSWPRQSILFDADLDQMAAIYLNAIMVQSV